MLAAIAGLPVQGALLDAGGGTGRISKALQGMATSVVVADISLAMLRQATSKNGLEVVCSQTEALPFTAASFARVVIVDAFHHVCDQEKTAAELWRVLSPGGRIVIEEPDIRVWMVKLVAVLERLAFMRSAFRSPANIAALFDFPGAEVDVQRQGYIAWIIVKKKEETHR